MRTVAYAVCRCEKSACCFRIFRLIGKTRDILYNALCSFGYDCVYPDGAFYLFVRSPIADAKEFCERAKALDLLLVPVRQLWMQRFVRISYCVDTNMIRRSLPLFKKLIESL